MRYYTGIHLYAKEPVVCVIDDKDTIHLRQSLPNHLEKFLSALQAFTPKPAIALEATLNWYWLVDGLQGAGFEVKLAHPFGPQVIKKAKVKTDNSDAFHLARLLRLEALPEAYIYPKEKRPVRDLLRKRRTVVSLRASDYVTLHRVLLQHGISNIPSATKKIDRQYIKKHRDHPALQIRCAAAALAVRYTGSIRRFREKHMARRRSKARKMISISIVAHKLATAAYYMLTRQEPFRQELTFGSYQ